MLEQGGRQLTGDVHPYRRPPLELVWAWLKVNTLIFFMRTLRLDLFNCGSHTENYVLGLPWASTSFTWPGSKDIKLMRS